MDVVLVDKNDKVIGLREKFEAHKNPVPLHRAVSVVIFDPKGEKMLIHQRASEKKTWPGYWTNATCTHPNPEESYKEAASRRLYEEMGFRTPLTEIFRFIYNARFDKTWGEHELDVVFVGKYKGSVKPNKDEVSDYKWIAVPELWEDVLENPDKYTPWFKIILSKLKLTA